jgi:hypothetical protein
MDDMECEQAGDTGPDAAEALPQGEQLPSLPPMVGQDGKPLIVPVDRARDN